MESSTRARPGAQAAVENNSRTTLDRACAGFDPAFERALADEIVLAIARASLVTDQNVMAIRTGETIAALATVIAMVLSLVPDADVPSKLRAMVDQLARRIRRDAARARAEGLADFLGAARGGACMNALQRRQTAARVIDAMAKGSTLHLMYTKSGSRWALSNGKAIASDVALMVVNDLRIVGAGDALFGGGPGQSWHYADPAS
jgi:hypothetical protein